MQQATLTELTAPEIGTIYNADDGIWTAWTVGNSRVWGTGKTEQAAINDMWIYQGLMEDAKTVLDVKIQDGSEVVFEGDIEVREVTA